jgi:hypothetical protein
MKQKSLPILAMSLLAVLPLACGNGVIDDPATSDAFATLHGDQVNYDCTQTVNCSLKRGDSVRDGDSIGACEAMSGAMLDADVNLQSTFLTNYSRCKAFQECTYVDCAMSGAHGYGETQRAVITYDCQQKLSCKTSQGTFMGDPNQEVTNCISSSIGLLDTFAPERRRQYESAYMRCTGMTSCAFDNCFVY